MRWTHAWTLAACALGSSLVAQAPEAAGDLPAMLARVGAHVQRYYARARSVVCIETVQLQALKNDLSPAERPRRLVYELRIEWDPSLEDNPSSEATVVRRLLTVDGRPPRPKDEPGCMDPKSVSQEPLALLLPSRSREYAFAWAGTDRVDRRATVRLDYRGLSTNPPEVNWKGECVSINLPGRTRGRVWIDASTDDVLRIDERLTGTFEIPMPRQHTRHGDPMSMTIERADSSIRYRPVTFQEPEEMLMLPSSIDSLTVIRNAGVPRLRTVQTFSGYKRFLTGGRVVADDAR